MNNLHATTQSTQSRHRATNKEPGISDLMRGRIDLCAIDTLVNMLAAGLRFSDTPRRERALTQANDEWGTRHTERGFLDENHVNGIARV